MDWISSILDLLVQTREGWGRFVWLLIGLALGLTGLAFVVLTFAVRRGRGYVTEARLLGAVKRPAGRDRKTGEALDDYWPALEYRSPDGEVRRVLASESGSRFWEGCVKGKQLQVRVLPHASFDDVYRVDDRHGLVFGLALLLTGALVTGLAAGQYGVAVIVLLLFALLGWRGLRFLQGVEPTSPVPDPKVFDPGEVEPLEAALRHMNRQQQRRSGR